MLKLIIVMFCVFSVSASAQSFEETADDADQYVDAMELAGKSGKSAMEILNANEFNVCRQVSGVLTNVPKDEPLLFCQRHSKSKFGCRTFQVVMKMNWRDGQLTVPEMLKEMPETPVQWVSTLCI